ncbi:hypothetical protein [Lactiplantibacillus modestisalitolerans]|uniref:Integral membrane protein n=1 Tax=Lactiplantibacillus modestisalitolerans TaxID=1457219 RepID=A0ABV5WU68_9LACO|nr:hypothetical protein [Lactiplantibacillus modestisalitolerans]
MRQFYQRYRKQFNGFVWVSGLFFVFLVVFIFGVKGLLDYFTIGRYDWGGYWTSLIHNFLGTFIFFVLILIVECLREKYRRQR